jgi:kinesin family protein 2/24
MASEINWSWVDFELGEDVRDERRLIQDEAWRNAVQDGRAHVSHRELARAYSPQFKQSIAVYESLFAIITQSSGRGNQQSLSPFRRISTDLLVCISEFLIDNVKSAKDLIQSLRGKNVQATKIAVSHSCFASDRACDPFRLYARKRPIFDWEQARGEHDIASTSPQRTVLTIHDGKLARNGRQLTMHHRDYFFHGVFNESSENEEICAEVIEPLVKFAEKGGASTCLCFGQTGTGKTYTLMAALRFIATCLDDNPSMALELVFYEIHGKKCYDLLGLRKPVYLRCDENGKVHVRGANIKVVQSSSEMMEVLAAALQLRSSCVTERNPISSRSHAVCNCNFLVANGTKQDQDDYLTLDTTAVSTTVDLATSGFVRTTGKISLVDLAGSERTQDTDRMNSDAHRESGDINTSLMALKNCFRTFSIGMRRRLKEKKASHPESQNLCPSSSREFLSVASSSPRIPFRASLLTRVLQECFDLQGQHRTSIITTISPCPTDSHHSIQSLEHVTLMVPALHQLRKCCSLSLALGNLPLSHEPPSQWTTEQLIAWMAVVDGGRFVHLALPPGTTGADLLRLDVTELSALCAGELRRARQDGEGAAWVLSGGAGKSEIGRALYASLHREELLRS